MRVLLVVDRDEMCGELRSLAVAEGHRVQCEPDGLAGVTRAVEEAFDAVVLDTRLPGLDPGDLGRVPRWEHDSAILTLHGPGRFSLVAVHLDGSDRLGTFARVQFLSRVALCLRSRPRVLAATQPRSARFGGIEVDFESGRVSGGATLTAKEGELLRYLIGKGGETVSREELLTSVWRYHPNVASRTIDVHISSLRGKVEANPRRPRHLHTVRGVGYRFVE